MFTTKHIIKFYHLQKLINPILADEPNPLAANALQEGLGGQPGKMRTMMQTFFKVLILAGNAALSGFNTGRSL